MGRRWRTSLQRSAAATRREVMPSAHGTASCAPLRARFRTHLRLARRDTRLTGAAAADEDDFAERVVVFRGRHIHAVALEQFRARHALDVPPLGPQIVDDVVALAGVHERRHVDVYAEFPKGTGHLPYPVGIEIDDAGYEFGSDSAARHAERGDVIEQPV